jgi:dephospho-CoA kinase
MSNRCVLGVVGMPGAGKSVVDGVAVTHGFAVVVMGDVIRDEVERRNLAATPKAVGDVMLVLREEEGDAVIAQRCVSKILTTPQANVIVDGVMSHAEVDEFHCHFHKFKILAIHASPQTRFHRLFKRRRSDDAGEVAFRERDYRELQTGKGGVIALADYMIVNEGTLAEFKAEIEQVLRDVLFDCRNDDA